ncbi:MAG: cell division protein FtsA [Candidatus Coatesbacteria bacterium]|nr:cell division protein FtsA [Candidatus Coatesbacteria bacterium]
MAHRQAPNVVVGLDIGTTKICAIIAEVTDGAPEIIGVGTAPAQGLRRGVVVHIEDCVKSISEAVSKAELMADVEVGAIFAGVAGGHIKSFNSRGVIAVSSSDHEIREHDVKRVIDAAQAIAIPLDREVIHVLPQEYIVDDQDGIKNPVGMSGVRLESEVHIVTGAVTSVQNIVKSVERAGLKVADIVLEPLASSRAVLTEDEEELGVALVDIGGGTTDIAMIIDGALRFSSIIALGGNNVTNDVSIGLRTPTKQAEVLKCAHGSASYDLVGAEEMIEVPSVGGRPPRLVSRNQLVDIIEPRMAEIFELVKGEIVKSKFADAFRAGYVLTGGASKLPGACDLAERVFGAPVRLAKPQPMGGLFDSVDDPAYSTGVGLVLYAAEGRHHGTNLNEGSLFENIINRMKSWLKDFF